MTDRQVAAHLLVHAGRLLLEYNESSGEIVRTLEKTAEALTEDECHLGIDYHRVLVSLGENGPACPTVKELRYNAAAQMRVHQILDDVRRGDLDAAAALARLGQVEAGTPRHPVWLVALLLGGAAASFGHLLGADHTAALVAAVAASLGYLARQVLGGRQVSLLALPLVAALVGAVLGGLAIRLGWTRSPELVLVVPALMVVPGPHLINGFLDLLDNHVPMSLFRLGLAGAILLSAGLGLLLGIELTIPSRSLTEHPGGANHLNLVSDMLLAGIATCGFAVFYNVPWRNLWMVASGGIAGHGIRFLALQAGARPEAAAFVGGLTVGAVSAWMASRSRSPIAVIGFAGAVTMIPGLSLFRGLSGARRLALLADGTTAELAARTMGHAFQAGLVVGGLGLGLVIGARVMHALVRE